MIERLERSAVGPEQMKLAPHRAGQRPLAPAPKACDMLHPFAGPAAEVGAVPVHADADKTTVIAAKDEARRRCIGADRKNRAVGHLACAPRRIEACHLMHRAVTQPEPGRARGIESECCNMRTEFAPAAALREQIL
jgi:hypothetical protein